MRHPLFHFFLNFFSLFRAVFSLYFFYFTGPGCTFSVFYRFIWFHYNFSVFMVLIFSSRCHVFYPLFHLSGLPFSFFVNNLTFSLLSTFFIPSLRFFIPHRHFHTIFLPFTASPSRFYLFAHVYTTFFPLFSRFFAFFSTHFLSFFAFSAYFHRFTPSFCLFF